MKNFPFAHIISLISILVVISGIFGLIVWRGSVIWGIHFDWKTIIILSIAFTGFLILGMIIGNLPWKGAVILGTVLVWIIYVLWVVSPLLLLRDFVSIWYKIPPLVMIVVSVVWIGIGIFFGNYTKTTPLTLSSSQIHKDYTIVFLSDLHVEYVHNRNYIQKIIHRIEQLNPDFVLIGGDLMNIAKTGFVSAFEPFNQLKMPIYATLGNHDHMGTGVGGIFETTKIIPLRNQSMLVDGIQIVGIDDKSYRGNKNLKTILDESAISDSGAYTILLSHQPIKLQKLAAYPINLELAGHTHNGQFWPLSWIIGVFNDYAYGKYQEDDKIAFVSQGIGTWGAPIRIGTQSELVLISLKKTADK